MTTTPRRWMHSLLQRDRTLPQTRFPLSRYAASLSWKKKEQRFANDRKGATKVRRWARGTDVALARVRDGRERRRGP